LIHFYKRNMKNMITFILSSNVMLISSVYIGDNQWDQVGGGLPPMGNNQWNQLGAGPHNQEPAEDGYQLLWEEEEEQEPSWLDLSKLDMGDNQWNTVEVKRPEDNNQWNETQQEYKEVAQELLSNHHPEGFTNEYQDPYTESEQPSEYEAAYPPEEEYHQAAYPPPDANYQTMEDIGSESRLYSGDIASQTIDYQPQDPSQLYENIQYPEYFNTAPASLETAPQPSAQFRGQPVADRRQDQTGLERGQGQPWSDSGKGQTGSLLGQMATSVKKVLSWLGGQENKERRFSGFQS